MMIEMIPISLKRIVPRKVKNWLLPVVAKLEGRREYPVRGQLPKMLSVEPTNKCNLNCPFCLVGLQNSLPSTEHDLLPRGLGFMEFDLYEKIVRDASDFGIQTLQLHFQGEPLLHKQLPEMVRLANLNGLRTHLFTNGMALTEELANRIIDAGLNMMRFSADGASEETYRRNRVGGEFTRVYENMAMMVRLAKVKRSPIRLEWQMLALRNNEHEITKARRMAKEIGIGFFVKTFAVTDPYLVPLNQQYIRQMHIKPCMDIYRAIYVYWNGDVVACCYDLRGENIVGNLGENTLAEIWEGPVYKELLRRIDNACLDTANEPTMCRSCLKWSHEPWRTSDGKQVRGQEGSPFRAVSREGSPEEDLV